MKTIALALVVVAFISCNNSNETETTTDSSTIRNETYPPADNTRIGVDSSTNNDTSSYNRMNDRLNDSVPQR